MKDTSSKNRIFQKQTFYYSLLVSLLITEYDPFSPRANLETPKIGKKYAPIFKALRNLLRC